MTEAELALLYGVKRENRKIALETALRRGSSSPSYSGNSMLYQDVERLLEDARAIESYLNEGLIGT